MGLRAANCSHRQQEFRAGRTKERHGKDKQDRYERRRADRGEAQHVDGVDPAVRGGAETGSVPRHSNPPRNSAAEAGGVKTMRTPSLRDKSKSSEVRSETSRGKADRPARPDDIADPLLRHAVENKVMGLDGLQAARLALVELFGRIERLQQKIDEAFSG